MPNDFSNTALTGLDAASYDLSLISNNIANVNTLGYKSSGSTFAELCSDTSGDGIGNGVSLGSVQRSFDQGSQIQTGLATNVEINGDGFFMVKDMSLGQMYYTRAGDFKLDKNGYLVNDQGYHVQGYSGSVQSGPVNDLQIDQQPISPSATANINVSGNLDSSTNASSTQTMTVYDAKGVAHSLKTQFDYNSTGTNAGKWTATYTLDGDSAHSTTSLLHFNADGSADSTSDTASITVGSPSMALDIDMSKMTNYGGQGLTGPTATADGYSAGNFANFTIEKGGELFAHYTNGQTTQIGSIALSRFFTNSGLKDVGNNNWVAQSDVGSITTGVSGVAGLGDITSGVLEGSNVDLSGQMVSMISAQRNFQADSQIIKTGKLLDQTVINIDS